MTFPRIYSLSTVGIIKHYNHDYLFHEKRTDFIGPNGVGKSILADLLQLMFIYDKENIKFGTEDVKETRFIHTLPYSTACAYCFLNIIIQENKFITIGIQIPNQERKRIVPFVIAKSAELTSDKNQLSFGKDNLLFSRHFIIDGIIPEIQELADNLSSTHKLKLSFFKNKDDVQDYYTFLSNKEILPINLSRETNLKSFAKVIQSFSKAKTLKLSGKEASRNLKNFLFEETEENIKNDFDKEKIQLEKILKDYSRLNEEIKLLASKQKRLFELSLLFNSNELKLNEYKVAEVSNCLIELNEQKEIENILTKRTQELKKEIIIIENKIKRIPYLEDLIKNQSEIAAANHEKADRYKQLIKDIELLDTEITNLKMIILPKIDESWKTLDKSVDMGIRDSARIKEDVIFSIPYLEKYETYENIKIARERQFEEIDKLKQKFNSDKEQKVKLLQLFNDKKEDSLISWYIQNMPHLDIEKLQAVLFYAALPTTVVKSPKNRMRIINPTELDNFELKKTENGIWLKSGALSEFIEYNPDADLLMSHSEINTRMQQLVDKLRAEIGKLDEQLIALSNIRDGLKYDTTLFEYKFDIHISQISSIVQLETAVAVILRIKDKATELQTQKAQFEEELNGLQHKFNLRYKEAEIVERDLKKIKERWHERLLKLSRYNGEIRMGLASLQKEINMERSNLTSVSLIVINKQNELDGLNSNYYKHFNENIERFNESKKDLPTLKKQLDDISENYKRNYIETATQFEETKGGKNAELNYELNTHSYSFSVLERILLGVRIKTTDDITSALQDANNNRTQIADNIRDSMMKIFSRTAKGYNDYKTQIQKINTFFVNRKISGKYSFNVSFEPNHNVRIEDIQQMAYDIRIAAKRGELQFDQSITEFLEDFFKKLAKLKDRVPISQLLDPKTYFHLSAKLEDQNGEDISGSTGESYSAIALLGVARLSTQKARAKGIRFIILEELGSMDNTNFNIFPGIAEEFQYQIITMAPHTFNIGLANEWYAHHLIKGKVNDKINYHPSSSYFKTKDFSENLSAYLNKVTE